MNTVIYYDKISAEYFLSNTGCVDVLNYVYKIYDRKQVNAYWPRALDKYFKDDIGQTPVMQLLQQININPKITSHFAYPRQKI